MSWARELTELIGLTAGCTDPAEAAAIGLDRTLALVGADGGEVGYAGTALARCGVTGPCGLRLPLAPDGWLLVAGQRPLGEAEQELAGLLAGVIGVALDGIGRRRAADDSSRMLQALGDRQRLLERLTGIQRSIAERAPLHEVLAAVVSDCGELLDAAISVAVLIDRADPDHMVIAAGMGIPDSWAKRPSMPVTLGLAGRVLANGAAVMTPDYAAESWGWAQTNALGMRAAIGVPLHENGRLVGALMVGRLVPGTVYDDAALRTLKAFGEQASLAITDAANFAAAVAQAHTDTLTGLPNRTRFLERVARAQRRRERTGTTSAVLLIDLDGFKRVNDSFGHAGADELLTDVASRLEDCLRPTDTAARLGGDEFAVLLEGLERGTDANTVASRILLALEEPVEIQGQRINVSATIGVATDRGAGSDLLHEAGQALRRARSHGRNRYELFDPVAHAVALDHLRLETQLERAVAQGELVLHFQPIVMLGSGDVTGVEALVRWNHPERGLLGPGAFIPVAEHTRVISALGRWVINAACREALRWPRGGGGSAVSVSVNLSVAQLRQPGLIYEVAEALERSGLDPTNLILEVTETMLMDDVELAAETMASLKRLGVKLAVDDFGTGYCSLEYLRRFPIDILKIAKPFVDGIDGGDDRLARVILDLGRSLNLHVIAEGIERPEQAQALRGLGCRWGQGFHYARPQCARDVRQTIATARARASRLRAVEGGSVVVPRLGDLVAESAA